MYCELDPRGIWNVKNRLEYVGPILLQRQTQGPTLLLGSNNPNIIPMRIQYLYPVDFNFTI